jgi:hypothetical protein
MGIVEWLRGPCIPQPRIQLAITMAEPFARLVTRRIVVAGRQSRGLPTWISLTGIPRILVKLESLADW